MQQFFLNGKSVSSDVPDDVPLLWVIREELGLLGTKFGCGRALCGACTVHFNGTATRSCMLPIAAANGARITTIEGLSSNGQLHHVQEAWRELDVPQCGYCQSGQIMSAVSLLNTNPNPSSDEIDQAMSGNICRCGTYPKIRAAIGLAVQKKKRS